VGKASTKRLGWSNFWLTHPNVVDHQRGGFIDCQPTTRQPFQWDNRSTITSSPLDKEGEIKTQINLGHWKIS